MDVSVIICTYNRADSLRRTLQHLSRQELPERITWEVLVVDNNSSDHTGELTLNSASFFTKSSLRYFFEPNQGLSHARNRGVSEAFGQIILFTDDDVIPECDWAFRILDGFRRFDCDACGGYVAPEWEVPPPEWLTDRFYGFLALRTDESGPYAIQDAKDAPFGANMAFSKAVFDRVGLFDTTRGRVGKVLSSGEDGEFFERVLSAGMTVMYFPQARVRHHIEASRTRKSYLRRWRFQSSRNLASTRGVPGERRLKGVPLYLFPQLLRAVVRAAVARVTKPADEAFFREMIVWHFLGLITGLWKAQTDAIS